jgi:predicted secreted protein
MQRRKKVKKGLSVAILALLMMSLVAAGCPPHPQPGAPPPGPLPPPDQEWSSTFGGTGADSAASVQQTADGGFIVAGHTFSFGAGGSDFWLVKTDEEGNKEWSRTFGGTDDDKACSVWQITDGGFIIAGGTDSFGTGRSDFWLVKTDEEGNKEWSRTFGGTDDDFASSLQQTRDGGFIVAGHTFSFGAGGSDFWLVKTDEEGNKEWSRTFGGTGHDFASSVQQTRDGGFIIAGKTDCAGPRRGDFWLIKTDRVGNKEWSRTFGGRGGERAISVQQTRGGGFIIAGDRIPPVVGLGDLWLVKTDQEGSKEWSRTFGGRGDDLATSAWQTTDSGFIVAGVTSSFGVGKNDLWLIKTDKKGNKEWNKTFGGAFWDRASSVRQTTDSGFIVAGETTSFGAGTSDFWLIKVAPVTGQ